MTGLPEQLPVRRPRREGVDGSIRKGGLAVAFVLAAGLLAGCSLLMPSSPPVDGSNQSETEEDDMADYGGMKAAIEASDDRVLGVRELKRTMSGFASGMFVLVDVESPEPLSAQTVKSILDAIWNSTDRKPVDFSLVAAVEGTENTADVRAAATELVGESGWNKFGNKGVTILSGSLRELMEGTD